MSVFFWKFFIHNLLKYNNLINLLAETQTSLINLLVNIIINSLVSISLLAKA